MVNTLTYQKEKLEDIYDEALPIFFQHWREISQYPDIKLEPDIASYYKKEDLGICHIWTAREDAELVGYAIFMVSFNPHYKSSKQAYQDILYISKERRGFGKDFIRFCDDELKKMGVQVVRHHVKFAHDWSILLEKMGYVKEDMILSRRLDKE